MKILWNCLVWPEPGSSAAGLRTLQLMQACAQAGHSVHVSSSCQPNQYKEALEALGFSTSNFKPNDSAFDEFVRGLQPDVVFFDRFMIEEQFSWRVKEQCPNALRVLDTVDLHFLRRTRERIVAKGGDALAISDIDLISEDSIRELAAIYRSDLSLIISDVERELLINRLGVSPDLLGLCLMFYPIPERRSTFSVRKHFISIGNFNHPPNADSFRILKREVWPKIREMFGQKGTELPELHIYGAYPTKEFTAMDDPASGFRVKGWAKELRDLFSDYRVNLAPLRFGAGIKGKICDGWITGTPCVATSIAAEGMHTGMNFGGAIADNWGDYAKCAAELYLNEEKWQGASDCGLQIMADLFDEKRNVEMFLRDIDDLLRTGQSRRTKNFVGAMLWHHQFRSTEFLSRWIEAKNR